MSILRGASLGSSLSLLLLASCDPFGADIKHHATVLAINDTALPLTTVVLIYDGGNATYGGLQPGGTVTWTNVNPGTVSVSAIDSAGHAVPGQSGSVDGGGTITFHLTR